MAKAFCIFFPTCINRKITTNSFFFLWKWTLHEKGSNQVDDSDTKDGKHGGGSLGGGGKDGGGNNGKDGGSNNGEGGDGKGEGKGGGDKGWW